MKFSTIFLSLFILISFTYSQNPADDPKLKFSSFIDLIERAYVDEVDESELTENAIKSILKELDPHSIYIPASDVKKMNEPLTGNFEGIGIEFNILNDTIMVVSPISGGPSEKLGIQSGDRIIKIEDTVVAGIGYKNEDVIRTLRGPKGTKVTISIMRDGMDKLIEYTIIRDKIPIFSVDAGYMATPTIGYIKVNRFAANTVQELITALSKLKENKPESLILDLRGNSGGYLHAAVQMADQFLEEGKMIVYTQGIHSLKEEYKTTNKGLFQKGKLVVLIDEGSASASEIVSGAIQDHDRGIVIGRRSFGKGLVQKPYTLPDGSAIRLTVARYYTPTGRSIQKPYEGGTDAYRKEIYERLENGELVNPDSIHFPDSLKFKTPNGRIVYGGGGIMPDIFVPLDTTKHTKFYEDVRRKGVINNFALEYADKNRNKLMDQYKTVSSFDKQFIVDDKLKEEFIKYAKKKGVEKSEDETFESVLKDLLKALIARDLWGSEAYFEVINQIDPTYQKAIEILQSDNFGEMKINY